MLQLSGFNVNDPKFQESLQKSPGAVQFIQELASACRNDNQAFFKVFQSHINLQGSPVEPNTTLEQLLATVNSHVKQENVQPQRLINLLFDKESGVLAQSGKLSLPLFEFHYASGSVDSQNRNRLCLLGTLAALVAFTMHKMLGVSLEEAKLAVLSQQMHVIQLSYTLSPTGVYRNYNTLKPLTVHQLQDILDGQATIHFNGSRQVQEDEKVAVSLSMRGIDVTDNASIENGYRLEKINAADFFTFRSLNLLWKQGNGRYDLYTQAGCERAVYEKRHAKVVNQLVGLVYRVLWSWESDFQPGKFTLRSALSGVIADATPPKEDSKTGKWSMKKCDQSQLDTEYFTDMLDTIWERKSPSEWEELIGEPIQFNEYLNFFELATQLYYLDNTDVIFARQLSIKKVDEEQPSAKRFPKIGNALLYILQKIEENSDRVSDDFSGVESWLGMNVYLARGEEEDTTTPVRTGVDLSSLLEGINLDFADVDF